MGSPNPQFQVGILQDPTMIQGKKRNVIEVTAARTLTTAESGSLIVFNVAAGAVVTLPAITADDVGTMYEFFVRTTITSNAMKVITDAGTTFILGDVTQNTVAATPSANDGPKTFAFNGTSHIAISSNGSTTGGVAGTRFRLTAIATTLWEISGHIVGSGVQATPASAS